MYSDKPGFWDERFRHEGAIWGDGPSVTAQAAVAYLPPNARVLEVGFGYGRDLAYLSRHGYQVSGIDLSTEARSRAEERLRREGLVAERLATGRFEDNGLPAEAFDAVLSHRMAHLLVTDDAVGRFVVAAERVLRPGGILCLSVRNSEDVNPTEVVRVFGNVYDYTPRPGHRIRFWDDDALRAAFGKAFAPLMFRREQEIESAGRPLPCHLTLMIAKKRGHGDAGTARDDR